MRGRRDKGDPELEQEFQRYIGTRLYNAPHPFPAKDVVELTGNLEMPYVVKAKAQQFARRKNQRQERMQAELKQSAVFGAARRKFRLKLLDILDN